MLTGLRMELGRIERTGSAVAERILASWEAELPRFAKVMPHDYKRALAELAEEEETSRVRERVA